jgi:hypothetical protein
MAISKTIAGLIGPTLVAIAAGMLLNFGSFPALAEQISRDPALIFVSGILLFIAGLAIVRAHNIWAGGWPVLVTVLGWLALLSGLARMLFPTRLAAIAAEVGGSAGGIVVGASSFWCLAPFSRSRPTAATKASSYVPNWWLRECSGARPGCCRYGNQRHP